jgi:hypothetical protein
MTPCSLVDGCKRLGQHSLTVFIFEVSTTMKSHIMTFWKDGGGGSSMFLRSIGTRVPHYRCHKSGDYSVNAYPRYQAAASSTFNPKKPHDVALIRLSYPSFLSKLVSVCSFTNKFTNKIKISNRKIMMKHQTHKEMVRSDMSKPALIFFFTARVHTTKYTIKILAANTYCKYFLKIAEITHFFCTRNRLYQRFVQPS